MSNRASQRHDRLSPAPQRTGHVTARVPTAPLIGPGREAGERLPAATQTEMAGRFGHNFSHVRIHANDRAAVSARAFGARAYTVGPDIVFGAGEYRPGTREGRRL